MAKYHIRELGPELASIYQEYINLTEQLRDNADGGGVIDPTEALNRVEKLKVKDLYGAEWGIDPVQGYFVVTDTKGARTVNMDPRHFQPRRQYQPEEIDAVPAFEYEQEESAPGAYMPRRKKPWWVVALIVTGCVVGGGVLFGGGYVTHSATTEPIVIEPTEDPRPTLPAGEGPTAERVTHVLSQLQSGNAASISYVVADTNDEAMLRWAVSTLGSLTDNGHRLQEVRSGDLSVLQVVNNLDEVVMQGDLEWEEDPVDGWVLAEIPLMSPVDEDVVQVPLETESPTPDATEEPTETPDSEESKSPEGEPEATEEPSEKE